MPSLGSSPLGSLWGCVGFPLIQACKFSEKSAVTNQRFCENIAVGTAWETLNGVLRWQERHGICYSTAHKGHRMGCPIINSNAKQRPPAKWGLRYTKVFTAIRYGSLCLTPSLRLCAPAGEISSPPSSSLEHQKKWRRGTESGCVCRVCKIKVPPSTE